MGSTVIATAPGRDTSISNRLKAQAYGVGFDFAGIATLGPAETADAFDDWVSRGFSGDMSYLPRGSEKRRDTRLPFPGAVSALVVGLDYGGTSLPGPIARYARGDDYHDVMERMLESLHDWLAGDLGHEVRGRAYVDTGPILERDLARQAGLGWFGKNTNLINPDRGSWFFLGALLVEVELEPDVPFEADRCGSCTRCLDACPTSAFVEPRVLDATRCISYLTIENRGAIPAGLRTSLGSLLYGCDICQDVCPWNVRFARELPSGSPLAPREENAAADARELAREILVMSQEDFARRFKGSPMKRAKLRGLKRNAAVVLGNAGEADDIPVLMKALDDPEPLVREHAAWAADRIQGRRHPKG